MPFEKINISTQQSQKAIIQVVCDDFLICKVSGLDQDGDSAQVDALVSRPKGLRTLDYIDGIEWDRLGGQQRVGKNDGSYSGITETIHPLYHSGEEVYFTKKVSEPLDTNLSTGQSYYSNNITSYNPSIHWGKLNGEETVLSCNFQVDENKMGRTWNISAGGSSVPSGYVEKCVVFCESGINVTGAILFKTGCSGII